MANITRSAKSGDEWTSNELKAYNIIFTFQDAQTFFDEIPLPAPSVSEDILSALTADDAVDDASYGLLAQLDLAMIASPAEEGAVVDSAVELLRSLGYVKRPRVIRTCMGLRFRVCEERKWAKSDICIIDRDVNDIILLVQEDRQLGDS
jgi:hypothetical protein